MKRNLGLVLLFLRIRTFGYGVSKNEEILDLDGSLNSVQQVQNHKNNFSLLRFRTFKINLSSLLSPSRVGLFVIDSPSLRLPSRTYLTLVSTTGTLGISSTRVGLSCVSVIFVEVSIGGDFSGVFVPGPHHFW